MKKAFVIGCLLLVLLAFAVPVVSGGTWNAGQHYIDGPGEDDYEVPDPNGAEYTPRYTIDYCETVITPNGVYHIKGHVIYCMHTGTLTCEPQCTPIW